MAIASGVAYTSVRLFTDVKSGLMARFITMPIKRSSILWAHVLTSLVANVLTIVVVILVALLMGFRSSANILDWLAVAGILGMFTLANMASYHSRIESEVYGRGDCLLVPTRFSSIY